MDGIRPGITDAVTPVEVFEGDAAILSCKVTGTPSPEITWLIEGEPVETGKRVTIDFDGERSSLCFSSTELDDEGEYECKAQNEFGSATCTLELLVNEIVDEVQTKPEFVEKMEDLNTFEGDSAVFSVKVQGHPQPEVQWFTSDREITTDERFVVDNVADGRHTFTIKECEAKDKGRYKCVASNVVGKTVCSAGLTVKEQLIAPKFSDQPSETPTVIDEGGDVTLQVEVSGKPEPSVKWYKDDKPISRTSSKYKTDVQGDKQTLIIVAATPDDSGTYQCKATSPAGTATRDFNVNIEGELFSCLTLMIHIIRTFGWTFHLFRSDIFHTHRTKTGHVALDFLTSSRNATNIQLPMSCLPFTHVTSC